MANVVISNCVINSSPSKSQIYKSSSSAETGWSLCNPFNDVKGALAAHTGCLGGVELIDQLKTWLKKAGLEKIKIRVCQCS